MRLAKGLLQKLFRESFGKRFGFRRDLTRWKASHFGSCGKAQSIARRRLAASGETNSGWLVSRRVADGGDGWWLVGGEAGMSERLELAGGRWRSRAASRWMALQR